MDASIARDETLADVLGARARRTPFDRLVLDVAGGVLIGAAAVWARPTAWVPLLAAALCFVGYGCWAFTERHAQATPDAVATLRWRIARYASAALGLSAFVTLLFALLGIALGPMIS